MQSTTDQFDVYAASAMRPLSHRLRMSFDKTFDAGLQFFEIGVSSIGGSDIIAGTGEVVQEWDKYAYTDYSNRVISLEWSRQQDNPFSANLGMADIVLDNHDDFFTPGAGSAIDGDILPQRPVRIYSGFADQLIQVFVGITEGMPELSDTEKTAKFHCIDFLQTLYNRPLDESVIYQDMTAAEVLAELIESVGLTASQYDFDDAFSTIPFAYFEKGTKFGDAAQKLVQSDLGYLFMDENGMITYRNRQNFSDTPVYAFTDANMRDVTERKQDQIINVVEVKSKVREVQDNQKIWESTESVSVPVGATVEVWSDFQDPVTGVDDPTYTATPTDTASEYTANIASDGSGAAYADIDLTGHDEFSTSSKLTFENTGASNAFITLIRLFGTPAKVVREIYIREQDDASVDAYDEHVLTIDNDYVQNEDVATSLALVTLGIYAGFGGVSEIDAKANPALQLRDPVTVRGEDYFIKSQTNSMQRGEYTQKLDMEKRTVLTYFTIEVSSIGGADVIAP